jgi:hypothetical protein
MSWATVQAKAAAQQAGGWPRAAVAEPALIVERCLGEDLVQFGCRRVGVITHPMPGTGGQNREIARVQPRLGRLAIDVDPAPTGGHDMKRGVAVRLNAEAPWGAHHRSAPHR